MAKKKTFDVEIQEIEDEERTVLEVLISGECVGRIKELGLQDFEADFDSKKTMKVSSIDEAAEFIIREYNLHGMS